MTEQELRAAVAEYDEELARFGDWSLAQNCTVKMMRPLAHSGFDDIARAGSP